jgi:hypothetical protein
MDATDTIADKGQPTPPALPGVAGRKIDDIDALKGSGLSGGPSGSGGPAPGGKSGVKKNPVGRPPKNGAGIPAAKIDQAVVDPGVEAARAEFESVLVELLVSTTDGIADSRYEILKAKFPDAVARGMAEKARLTEKEKKYFGAVAIRLWRKYLGDKYLFTDEGIAAVYAFAYFSRNAEGFSQARKIQAEINGKSQPKQPGIPGAPGAGAGSERNGKDHASDTPGLQPPRAISPGV